MKKISTLVFILLLVSFVYGEPNIFAVQNISLNATEYSIVFNVSTASNATVHYGVIHNVYGQSVGNVSFLRRHNLTLSGLLVNTTYYYVLNVTNTTGQKNITREFNFTTQYEDIIMPNWTANVSYPNSPGIYSGFNQFNVTWWDSNISSVWIEHNFSGSLENYTVSGNRSRVYYYNYSLTPGQYLWRMFANDTNNNLNHTNIFHYTVYRANSSFNLTFGGQEGNTTLERGVYILLNASLLFGQGSIYLYSEETLINLSTNPVENISFSSIGLKNITAIYLQTENYTLSRLTYFINVTDTVAPVINVTSPLNRTYPVSSMIFNFTTDEISECYYFISNYTLIGNGTAHYVTVSMSDGNYSVELKCSDNMNNTATAEVNFTVDTIDPSLVILTPIYGIYSLYTVLLNYSLNDSNIDTPYYNMDHGSVVRLNISSQGINYDNITADWPGKHHLSVSANDTAGNLATQNITLYINSTFNATAWSSDFNATISARFVGLKNRTAVMVDNVSVDQDITLQINFTNVSMEIYNMSGLRAAWDYDFFMADSSQSFLEEVAEEVGTRPVDYLYVENFTFFYNTSSEYYAKAVLPKNISHYESIYYCSAGCIAVSACTVSYKENTSVACYNNSKDNVFIYLPQVASVFGDNDTLHPRVTMTALENNSLLLSSYYQQFNFTTNENATCKYSVDKGTYSNLTGTRSFGSSFSLYTNKLHNLTFNCSDGRNRGLSMIYFRMNDTAYPSLEDRDIDNGLRTLSFNLETDEPSNFTVFLIGNSSKKSSAYALTAQLNFTGLKTGREYDYAIYLCDRLSNCHNYTGSASTESVVTVATSASSSGGSGTSIMGVSKIWANMVEGENVMEISALSIAFTRLSIMLAKDINRTVTLTVSAVSLSNSTPSLDNPYQYIKIGESGISSQDIGSAVILFRVENEWLADIESVSLYRYTDKWDILDTQKVSSDSTYTYYRSNSPGLSLFGISGVKKIVEEAEPDGSGQPDVTGAVAADKKDILQPEREVPRAKINFSFSAILKYFLVGIVVLVLFSGVGFVVYAKGVHKEVDLSSLYKYVEECRRDGIEEEAIRKALMDSGWDKAIIDIGMTSVSIKTDLAPILDYIKKAREAGIKDDEIKVNLLSVGWSAKMISEAYDGFFK